jgi:hypothetical protein
LDALVNINSDPTAQQREALLYAAQGLSIFPVSAAKKPLVSHWRADATTDQVTIEAWLQKWQHCDFGWALPANVVVIDIDVKHGKNGYRDFEKIIGCRPQDVATPQATTPSGGLQLFYAASKPYKNAVAIDGTGIDVRALGGYVVLPLPGNGREWLRPLIDIAGRSAPLAPPPAWLDRALREAVSARKAPLTLAPRAALMSPSSDPYAQRQAVAQLERACAHIAAAPCGAQDSTRHAQCFYIGGLIARGDLDYATAYERLFEAACAMPAHHGPWPHLDTRVARSIEAGMEHPLAVSETELWMRKFRARMRLMRPTVSAGARHG